MVDRPARVLLLHGGWEGHHPEASADFAAAHLLAGMEVVRSTDLDVLDPATLTDFDLLVPLWTFGSITTEQCTALVQAVTDGLGLVTWHGGASAFLDARPHKFLLGGLFVAHPGGGEVTWTIEFGDDPLVEGLADVTLTAEQYYLLVDPGVHVLATTVMDGADMPWTAGVRMPVAWTRTWGAGRVFYCSVGHSPDELAIPAITELLTRGIRWAVRPA